MTNAPIANAPRLSRAPGLPSDLARATFNAHKTPRFASAKTEPPRMASLPQPGAAAPHHNGIAAITVAPSPSPLEIAASTQVPASYIVERTTTLRAVAARFGLPVELVALSNHWPREMKLLKGMEVHLPRPLQVSYNGVPVTSDAPSMILGETGVTAFRFLFEQSGGKLQWDAANGRVIARKGDQEIVLNIGSNVAKINDKEVAMELAAFLFEGRTMVPIRFFEESLHAQVDWNPQTGRLVVAMVG